MKRAIAILFVAGLLTAGALLSKPALAQDGGKIEVLTSLSVSIDQGAAITSATTGKRQVIKSMLLRSSTAGVVVFNDGTGSGQLAHVYLEANKPFVVPAEVLGNGIRSSSGNAIYAYLGSATLTAVLRVQRE